MPFRGDLTDATNIEMIWSQLPSGNYQGYASITGYKVYWDDPGTFQLRVSLNSASITSYQEAGVTQGRSYQFKLSAINVYGEGPLSEAVTITPASIPDAPTGVIMTSSDKEHITIEWSEEYDGGMPITEFRIYWDQGSATVVNFIASTPFTVAYPLLTYTKSTQIQDGVFYRFKVSAVNFIGESALSASSPSIIASAVSSEPLLLEQVEATQTSIELSWNPPLDNRGSPVTAYHVYMDGSVVTPTEGITGLSIVQETGIVTGFLHTFTVTALNGRGESAQSLPIQIYAATISTVPLLVRRKEATGASVTLEWDHPADNGGTPILDYEIWWDLGA